MDCIDTKDVSYQYVQGHPICGANQTARFVPREGRLYADKMSFLARFCIKRTLFV
jgi:hypothetical protein